MDAGVPCRFLRDVEVPKTGSLKVTRDGRVQYHVAIGEEYGEDLRGKISQYVSGVKYAGTGTTLIFDQRPAPSRFSTYFLKVKDNTLSPRPLNWCAPRLCLSTYKVTWSREGYAWRLL